MKNIISLLLGIIMLSSCQKEIVQPQDIVGDKKLTLIVVKWSNLLQATEGSMYYKITYDTTNHKILLDTDSTNADHEFVYEYNNLGQLIKCTYPDGFNNNQPMTFTYTRTNDALIISSNSQGIIEERVYNKTIIPGGYRYTQTVPNPSGSDYAQFDFTNQHIPILDIHYDGDIINPINYNKRVYTFQNGAVKSSQYYYDPNQPPYSESLTRGNGSTKLLFDFIKQLRGTDLLYFWGYDTDNFLGLEPERLGLFLFTYENYSDKELIGVTPFDPDLTYSNTFYNFGEIKSTTIKLLPEYEEQRNYFYQ